MLRGLSPRRRRFVGALAVVGLLGAVVTAVAVLPSSSPRDDGGDVPVVLVHGYGGSASDMTTIDAALRARGRRTVPITLPRNGLGDIAESAAAVERAVGSASRVDLVGYSLGGVVVRAWIDEYDGEERARYVVTLGSPHHGAQLADTAAALDPTACRDACAQLRPGSAFLRELNEDETPEGPEFTALWTAFDRTVTPPESAILDGATNVRLQDVCPDSRVGHGSINRDALPVGLTLLALEGRLGPRPSCEEARAAGR